MPLSPVHSDTTDRFHSDALFVSAPNNKIVCYFAFLNINSYILLMYLKQMVEIALRIVLLPLKM